LVPFLVLTVKAAYKRVNFWVLMAVVCALCVLAHFYDLFSLGEVSTLFPEVYAGLALLVVILAPVFCFGDHLEREAAGAAALWRTRPVAPASLVFGVLVGTTLMTWAILAALAATFYVTSLLAGALTPAAAHLVLPLALPAAFCSCGLVLLLAPRVGLVATIVILLSIFAASHMIPYFSASSPHLLAVGALLPNFHVSNVQSLIAVGRLPSSAHLFAALLSPLLYAAACCALALHLERRRYRTADGRP